MKVFTEIDAENAALEWLSGFDYAVLHGLDISPDGPTPERRDYFHLVLMDRMAQAMARYYTNAIIIGLTGVPIARMA